MQHERVPSFRKSLNSRPLTMKVAMLSWRYIPPELILFSEFECHTSDEAFADDDFLVVRSVTVVPRGMALGYTLMLPEMDKNSHSLFEYKAKCVARPMRSE